MKYYFDKLKLLILAIGIIFVGFIFSWFKFFNVLQPNQNYGGNEPIQTEVEEIQSSITIDWGNGKTFSKDKIAVSSEETALSILKQAGLTVTEKKYDFGTMVESIDNVSANDAYFWAYSVNGQMGNVSADKYVLKNGDLVEWKYTKIQ